MLTLSSLPAFNLNRFLLAFNLHDAYFLTLQVCSLVWAPEYKELVSAHGNISNDVTIWKYPGMLKTAELLGHTDRVLHLSLSADQTTVVRCTIFAFCDHCGVLHYLASL